MSSKSFLTAGCIALAASLAAGSRAVAQEAEAAPADNKLDAELQAEIKYVEALIEYGFPDFAEPVIAATKKKWPESDTLFFAIEIRGMLSLGKFDEAEKKVAALPDRKGSKYWAARLEIANNYFARGKKKECSEIYNEFFKTFPTPPKELREFYLQASYAYGQILLGDKRFEEAAQRYEGLLKQLNKRGSDEDANTWCNVACETAEIYIRLANDIPDPKKRGKYLDPARKLVSQLLWEQDKPVYFGRAIAMKAHIELLGGDVAKAQATIDDYMDQLAELHASIVQFDPDGKQGLLRQSPMPQCRFMLAEMLWNEAQAEFKKPKRDDERVKSLLFGEKNKSSGKRNNQGAYNHALNVFIKYPECAWAAKSGDMADAIAAFAGEKYGAKIKSNITPEQKKKVLQMQFRGAHEKLAEGDYEGAIADFVTALTGHPEGELSIQAIEAMVSAYGQLLMRRKNDKKAPEWRLDCDAVEGYLAERFSQHRDRTVMTLAGDATLRVAAAEKSRGELARADRLYKEFLINYRRHVNAATTAAAMAGEAQKDKKYADAIALWDVIGKYYTNSTYYATALANKALCHDKMGDRKAAIEAMTQYVAAEKNLLRQTQAQMNLATMYQKNGLDMIKGAETNEVPETAEQMLKQGSAQIIRGIQQFRDFAAKADKALADPSVTPADKKQYSDLKEGALYLCGDCWGRLTKPDDKLEMYRKQSVKSFEDYVKQFPDGKYAKAAYVKLAATYAALGDSDNSKSALDRLTKEFPDADETKNAKPRLAKLLVEMGKVKEGTEIYAEMLRTDGAYTAGQFLNAGEALIDAKSWEQANMAFEKAIAKAGTNQLSTVAKARIGQAKSLYKQKAYDEARNAIDAIMDDEKLSKLSVAAEANLLMVEVASEQGRTEKDDNLRKKHFGAAISAVKKLRGYWKNKEQWEQDKINLMSADVMIRRMTAEDAMGLKEQAQDTCESAAGTLKVFIQTRRPDEAHPADKMSAGELDNLAAAYGKLIPLLARLPDQGGDILKLGQEYLDLFPNGRDVTAVRNCMNQARAAGATATQDSPVQEPEASEGAGEEAPAAEPAADSTETSEGE